MRKPLNEEERLLTRARDHVNSWLGEDDDGRVAEELPGMIARYCELPYYEVVFTAVRLRILLMGAERRARRSAVSLTEGSVTP